MPGKTHKKFFSMLIERNICEQLFSRIGKRINIILAQNGWIDHLGRRYLEKDFRANFSCLPFQIICKIQTGSGLTAFVGVCSAVVVVVVVIMKGESCTQTPLKA